MPRGPMVRDSTRRLTAYTFMAAAMLLFWRGVLSSDYTVPWDFRGHHLPLAAAYADALSEGELPLWDPYTYCGRPLLANPQAAVFYPGNALVALAGRKHLLRNMEWLMVSHVVLAAWLAYELARRMQLREPSAVLAGLILALGGWAASQAQHLSSILGLPWLVAGWLALFCSGGWRVGLLAVALALHFFAGFTASTLAAGVSILLVAAWRRCLPQALAGAALALALAAAQILPSLELVAHSVGQYRTDWLKGGGGMPLLSLLSLVWPRVEGPYDPTMLYLFVSFTGLLLALAAARRAPALGVLAAVLCLVMLGDSTPIGRVLFQLLPRFLANTVFWYVFAAPFTLAVAMLAAHGSDHLLRKPSWGWGACVLVALELTLAGSGRVFNTKPISSEPQFDGGLDGSPAAEHQLIQLTGSGRYDTCDDALWLVTGAPLIHLRTASGYDPLALERLIQARLAVASGQRWGAWYQVEQPGRAAVDALGLRVLIGRGERPPPPGWRVALRWPGRTVYEREHPLPRFRLTPSTVTAADLPSAAKLMQSPFFQPAQASIVEGLPAGSYSTGTVAVRRESRHHLVLETSAPGTAFLSTSEPAYPGWTASIDGHPVPWVFTNVAFRGLEVPPGRHRVEFHFSSHRLQLGLWISAAAVLALIVVIAKGGSGSSAAQSQRVN
ncbi:MAG: YfhO family protein [Acidobacteria bacterium]|nr:YfhO family protein [Acidobacteriota bacterium]